MLKKKKSENGSDYDKFYNKRKHDIYKVYN